jgi:PKD repeat protein
MINNLPPQAAAGGPYGPISETFSLELNGTASTDPNGDALYYAWDLDNDGFYNDAFTHTVSYVWNEPGLYQVSLIVTDSHGLTNTTATNVNVTNLLPTAVISAPSTAQGGEVVTFDGSASSDPGGGPLQFSWDFDNDGFFDDGAGVVLGYRFKLIGVYGVRVQVSDNQGGQAIAVFTIQINSNAEDAYGVYLPIVRK